jgi:acetate kinase
MSAFKYREDQTLKDVNDYIARTYGSHYTNNKDTVQVLDLIAGIGDAESFCRSNAIKYLSRFGRKSGKNKNDLLKAIHYCVLLYYFSEVWNDSLDNGLSHFNLGDK